MHIQTIAAELSATAATPGEHRAAANAHEEAARESYERCDTDGALTQWAHGINAQKQHLAAQIAEQGGMWDFPALFDLDGNLVPAKEIKTCYGWAWMLLDENGRCLRDENGRGQFFGDSQARSEKVRRRNDAKKGFYVGRVRVPAKAELRGGNICTVMAIPVRCDDGFSADALIVDNGK